jgi:two-component system OmpR family response regulator
MAKPRTIMVVDDDSHIRDVLRYALTRAGFTVVEAEDGQKAVDIFPQAAPDLIVLDIMMPELEGTEVCRRLRRTSRVPIIFLSSADEETDRIIGLELGGDDYVSKPFSPRELVARVKAVLRRLEPDPDAGGAGGGGERPASDLKPVIAHGRLRLDANVYKALWDEAGIALTATEFHLLEALLRHPGRVYSRAELMERTYEDNLVVTDRTIDTHVKRIRRKFAEHGADPIETVHGLGYKLAACR